MAIKDWFCFDASTALADYSGEWQFDANATSISVTSGPFGDPYLAISANMNYDAGRALRPFRNGLVAQTVTFGFRFMGTPGQSGLAVILTDGAGLEQCIVRVNATGAISIERCLDVNQVALTSGNAGNGNYSVQWAGATGAVPINGSWNYLEFAVTMGAAGSFEARVNGVVVGGATAINIQANSSGTIGGLMFSGYGGITHGYVTDTTGSAASNKYLGDIRVKSLAPTGPGASSDFTPTGAATDWQAVAPSPPDPVNRYATGVSVGQTDLYTPAALPSNMGKIFAVAPSLYVSKTDAGTRAITGVVRSGATLAQGVSHGPGTAPSRFGDAFELDPVTGLAWTTLPQFGIKIIG